MRVPSERAVRSREVLAPIALPMTGESSPGVPATIFNESLERFAREVMPRVREAVNPNRSQ